MHSLTVENYVKAVFKLCTSDADHRAATGALAVELGVSPGTVTSMLKTLSGRGLATYTPYEGVRLTSAGESLALQVLRRHRLIELFLTEVLDMDWDEVHDDAEQMEHVLSDRLVERIDAYLGRPRFDPHGDPIPTPEGTLSAAAAMPLTECPIGAGFRLVRVVDQSSEFLRYLRDIGLPLAAEGRVLAHPDDGDGLTVQIAGREAMLPRTDAAKLLVAIEHPATVVATG